MATATLDIAPEYKELETRLADASLAPDGDEESSRLTATPWAAWISSGDDDSFDFRQVAKRRLDRTSMSTLQRRATLGVVMAWLQGFELDEAAALIGTSSPRLVSWLHGEISIPRSKDARLKQIADVIRVLWNVLEPAATNRWFTTSVPDLDGMTPLEAFRRNRGEQVERVVRSYLETSFS